MGKKEKTKEKLIQAVGKIIAEEGFNKLGVNKVAKLAGVDKVLVYRYFGGLPELVSEYSKHGDFWPTVEELTAGKMNLLRKMAPDAQLAFFFKNFLAALMKRPVTKEILAWEMLERNELTRQLENIRIRTALEFFELLENVPDREELKSIVVLMSGAIILLMIRSRKINNIGGIDLESESGMAELNRGIDLLLRGVFDG
jgi:AcrR family transcriptional regulator